MTDRDADYADSEERRRRANEAIEDGSSEIDDVAAADRRRTVNPASRARVRPRRVARQRLLIAAKPPAKGEPPLFEHAPRPRR